LNNTVKALDRASGYLFLVGFLTSKLKNIPVSLVGAIFNLVSLFAYLIGYVAWYIAAYMYKDYPRKREEWYGFAEFKIQYQVAALIGLVATIMCLIFPPLIMPVAWFYTVSNVIWSISEHHKKKNPPPDAENYSTEKQGVYFRYASSVALNSTITAVTATIVFLFPPLTFTVLTAAAVIGAVVTVAAIFYWGKHAFGKYPPDNDRLQHSYAVVSAGLPDQPEHMIELASTATRDPVVAQDPPAPAPRVANDEETDDDMTPLLVSGSPPM
jgi:hypothetical protein